MKIAITGATGFLGRYIVDHLVNAGHTCRCWYRSSSDRSGFENYGDNLEWIEGGLNDPQATDALVEGMDAVVHAALYHPGGAFRGMEVDLVDYVDKNVTGSIRLMQTAKNTGVDRFVFISTCAVHEIVLEDRPLDETHPLWATHHYGAHKAAIEKFVHSFGLGEKYPICALRPTGIYGLAHPPEQSKWFDLIKQVKAGQDIESSKGGKEVHAADVAKAVVILLQAEGIAGQSYNCYDMYIADQDVARIAKELTGSSSNIAHQNKGPKNQIITDKIQSLGMKFGGEERLRQTVSEILTNC
jgi:nucleoside-diphosphate-sugar epimerase